VPAFDLRHLVYVVGGIAIWRWGSWLVKALLAAAYRPVPPGFRCSTSVVTPVYQENPRLFRQAIESWLANEPGELIAVIDVTDEQCIKIASEYPGIKLIVINEPGKRAALAAGIDLAKGDVVVLVDSDVIWEKNVLSLLLAPFKDPQMGGVGTRQHMVPTEGLPTLWEKLADIYLDLRYMSEIPATSCWGEAVGCLSGRTAAYRTDLLRSCKAEFLNEVFLGAKCVSGDDKCYTRLVLSRGYKTVYQLNAHVYSTFSTTFRGFLRQRLRWSRNTYRSDLTALAQEWTWKKRLLAWTMIDKCIAPFTQLLAPVACVVLLATDRAWWALYLVIWWHLSRGIKLLPYWRRRPQDLYLLPVYILSSFALAAVRIYSLMTINISNWLTRDVGLVDGKVARLGNQTGVGS
jgi:glycosyltransferase involved in cell wall biosynthesis